MYENNAVTWSSAHPPLLAATEFARDWLEQAIDRSGPGPGVGHLRFVLRDSLERLPCYQLVPPTSIRERLTQYHLFLANQPQLPVRCWGYEVDLRSRLVERVLPVSGPIFPPTDWVEARRVRDTQPERVEFLCELILEGYDEQLVWVASQAWGRGLLGIRVESPHNRQRLERWAYRRFHQYRAHKKGTGGPVPQESLPQALQGPVLVAPEV